MEKIQLDHKNPDYAAVFRFRARALRRIRESPAELPYLKSYYREHPAQFITDWGVTLDPRNVELGRPDYAVRIVPQAN